ncbi:uncharacterized protein LOC110932789 [Helianthus annuus]|uniref:uncharacterized protein LOC110932789 n=1 Tax=Helianthus annuus TaxID=4232 RepID=UPI000B8EF80F|nr:uncharacterized protein LOC110932789 [Helianthus annuus]
MSIQSGCQTNAWSDNWCSCSPLRHFITPHAIANAGFNLSTTVAELINEVGQWRWPQAWFDIFPVLINIAPPQLLVDMDDRCRWKYLDGNLHHFRSWEVWNTLSNRDDRIGWADSVWFSQCIPRHSFHLWTCSNGDFRIFRNKKPMKVKDMNEGLDEDSEEEDNGSDGYFSDKVSSDEEF